MSIERTVKLLAKEQNFTTFHNLKKCYKDRQLERKKIRFIINVDEGWVLTR